MSAIIFIPEYPAERVQAEADRKWRGDTEKVPTTPLKHMRYLGVHLTSRYDKAHDYREMVKLVDALPYRAREIVKNIWCDTKACSAYSVTLRADCPRAWIDSFVKILTEAARRTHGHNGIVVEWREESVWIEPDWFEDFGDDIASEPRA